MNNTTQYSPSPWKFGLQGFDDKWQAIIVEKPLDYRPNSYYNNPKIYDANNNEVVGCDEYYVFSNEHDIRLMLAAPELLEALRDVMAILEERKDGAPRHSQACTYAGKNAPCTCGYGKARAAIAKAEGK